jgi:4-hydroxymandelate oxidase
MTAEPQLLSSLDEYAARARDALPPAVCDFFAGGAGAERTLLDNHEAFGRWVLRPRVLVDVSDRDISTTVLGTPVRLPVLVAPMSMQRMAHPDGEVATARAAAAAGTVMVLSTLSTYSIEEVATAAPKGPRWFQLYVHRDRELTADLVRRASSAGYGALVLTVDAPMLGIRERDARNQFTTPPGITFANVPTRFLPDAAEGESGLFRYIRDQQDASIGWDDVAWLRSLSEMPVVLKGIVTAEDAAIAAEAGIDGIVVSNHGGRQLDGTIASLDALPEVVEAVEGRCEVFLDGGVRRGSDVLMALAQGARAVLLGRPVLWGLSVDGEGGVLRVLQILGLDLDASMAIAGCRTVGDVSPALVRRKSL